jgi:large subunit ribosomal protein L9
MKVVLLKQVRKLGKIGDVIDVKDGFGRNFLIPKNLAARATSNNLTYFEEKKAELEAKNNELLEVALKIAKNIDGKDFIFTSQTSDDGRLFGSVSAKDIADLVSKVESSVSANHVVIDAPIKQAGVHEVMLHLHADVEAKIIIVVARTETEAKDALASFKQDPVEAE